MLSLPSPSSHPRSAPAGAAISPEFASRIRSCSGAGILVLDDGAHIARGVAHDAPIPRGVVEIDGEHGEAPRRRASIMLEGRGTHQRHVAVQHQDRVIVGDDGTWPA